jgi:uncharacterized protein (DUF2236 family)
LVLTEELTVPSRKIFAQYATSVKLILEMQEDSGFCPSGKALVSPADSVIGKAIDLLSTALAVLPADLRAVGWAFLPNAQRIGWKSMSIRPVSAPDLETLLAELSGSVSRPEEGIFGPHSISWKVNRESALFLAAGRAALLQLAHPWVATAIAQHSRTLDNPIARFHHTFRVIFTMIFGTAEQALAASRQLHRLHQTIEGVLPDTVGQFSQGTRYEANEVAALRWVYATLVDSALLAYELLLPPLTEVERKQYFAESLRTAALFGIAPQYLPSSWPEFNVYMESMLQSDALGVSGATLDLAQKLQAGAGLSMTPPFWYRALTIQLLPRRLRKEFGLPYSENEQVAAERAIRWVRRLYPKLPSTLRFVGPYNEATNRIRGKGPGSLVRLSNRLWTGQATLFTTQGFSANDDHAKLNSV